MLKMVILFQEHRYHGVSDGMFEDEQFFVCEKNCAVFVALDSLSESHNTGIIKPPITSSADNGITGSNPIDNVVETLPSSGKSY